ncbi:TRAP transporter small permease [Oscillospiraceae bacterium LTW-04]|nr:TRAP transporter small permease [Oscillospiraceae bacterium MB24-C1]
MVIAKVIRKVSDLVNNLCSALCIMTIVAMVLVTGMQIFCRVFFTALSWSEEVTRYLLVWSTFIGCGIVYKNAGHISVTMMRDHCPPKIVTILKIVTHLICAAFCTIAVYYGFKYMAMQGKQLSAALRIPMRYMYMAIPVGCFVIDLHILDAIIQLTTKINGEVSKT